MTGTSKFHTSRRRVSGLSSQSESDTDVILIKRLNKDADHDALARCSMLGYGGTDKPADSASYIGRKIAEDLIDIVNNEKAESVIAIGHDWYAL